MQSRRAAAPVPIPLLASLWAGRSTSQQSRNARHRRTCTLWDPRFGRGSSVAGRKSTASHSPTSMRPGCRRAHRKRWPSVHSQRVMATIPSRSTHSRLEYQSRLSRNPRRNARCARHLRLGPHPCLPSSRRIRHPNHRVSGSIPPRTRHVEPAPGCARKGQTKPASPLWIVGLLVLHRWVHNARKDPVFLDRCL